MKFQELMRIGDNVRDEPVSVSIDSHLASRILEMNTDNRHIRKSHVSYFFDLIASGEYIENHPSPIVVNPEERLLVDGQHRLLAICRSGNPVKVYVYFSCNAEVQKHIDNGIGRSIYDRLRNDIPPWVKPFHISVANYLLKLSINYPGSINTVMPSQKSTRKATPDRIIQFMAAHSEAFEGLEVCSGEHTRGLHKAAIWAAWIITRRIDSERAVEFAIDLVSQLGVIPQARLLRDFILRSNLARYSGVSRIRLDEYQRSLYCMMAYVNQVEIKKVLRHKDLLLRTIFDDTKEKS